MDLSYIITPFFTWFVTGCIKFVINSIKQRKMAINLIGYGGMPSNHSSISSSTATIIALKEGLHSPALVIALAFTFIVILDASSLRKQVGLHAKTINKLNINESSKLRERIGHTKIEITAGIVTGIISATCIYFFYK
jgi:uncharacterized protein